MWWFFVREFYRLADAPASAASVGELVRQASPVAPEPSFTSHLQRLATDGSHAFGVWDAASGFSMFSANWSRITGLPMEACAGFNLVHQLTAEDQFTFHTAMENAANAPSHVLARTREDATGEPRHLVFDVLPPQRSQPYATVLVRDITAQKQLEQALNQKEAALHTANRGRSAFLSCMSHELRTPLNAIMGFSAMMREEMLGKMKHKGYAEYADHIHDSGQTLLTKINDLLEIAALDAGGMRIDERDISIADLFAELQEIHSHALFERGITLHMDDSHVSLFADKRKLVCALSHMLSNAMRFSAEGAAIYLQCNTMAGGDIVLSVRDYGEGIATETLANIMHALNSESSYAHIRSDGIGLGLSLSKEIAAQHGGHLMLDTMRKQGTVVSLVFPAHRLRGSHKPHARLVKR